MDATSGVFSSLKLSASTTPTSGYLIPMNMIKKCCQNFRMIDTSFSNPIQKYLLKYSRNLFYGPTCTHRMSCQPQAINDISNFDMNDPTSRPGSDIFSVISAGTVSENSFFPQFERVTAEQLPTNGRVKALIIYRHSLGKAAIASKNSCHRFLNCT
jgi:hypothetical protein